jgi:hypothetical protein
MLLQSQYYNYLWIYILPGTHNNVVYLGGGIFNHFVLSYKKLLYHLQETGVCTLLQTGVHMEGGCGISICVSAPTANI